MPSKKLLSVGDNSTGIGIVSPSAMLSVDRVTLHPHEVQAILAGRQTQLRRPVEPQPPTQIYRDGLGLWYPVGPWGGQDWRCSFGQAGDVLDFDEFALKVTAMRVERVRDISEGNAQREGWFYQNHDLRRAYDPATMDTARKWLRDQWTQLYPAHPWESAWCWVAEFEVVK